MQNLEQRVNDIPIDHGDADFGWVEPNNLHSSSSRVGVALDQADIEAKTGTSGSEWRPEGTNAAGGTHLKNRSSKAPLVLVASLLCIGGFFAGLIGSGMHNLPNFPKNGPLDGKPQTGDGKKENRVSTYNGESSTSAVGPNSSASSVDTFAKVQKQQAQIVELQSKLEKGKLHLRELAEKAMQLNSDDRTSEIHEADNIRYHLLSSVQRSAALISEGEKLKREIASIQRVVDIIDTHAGESTKFSEGLGESRSDLGGILAEMRQLVDSIELQESPRESGIFEDQSVYKEALDSRANQIRLLLDSLTTKLKWQQERLDGLNNVEEDIVELTADLNRLEKRLLSAKGLTQGISSDKVHYHVQVVLASCGELRDKWRQGLLFSTSHSYQTTKESVSRLRKIIIEFINSVSESSQIGAAAIKDLGVKVWEEVERYEDDINSDPVTNIRRSLLWGLQVKLGVSVALNNRQLGWEGRRGHLLSATPKAKDVRSLEEGEEEIELLEPIKNEIRNAISAGIKTAPSVATEEDIELFEKIIGSVEPLGDHTRVLVRNFKLLGDSLDADGSDVEFRVLQLAGRGSTGLVAMIQPVDPDLRAVLGDIAMKMSVINTPLDEDSLEFCSNLLTERCNSELAALATIRNEGESHQDVLRRTRVLAATHVGYLSESPYLTYSHDGESYMALARLSFFPALEADFIRLHMGSTFPALSMKARVYLAHSILTSIAHMHSHGYCHNDLKPENVGFMREGELVIFDCDALEEPGEKRRTFTGSNLAPESAEEFGNEGQVVTTFKGDSWGAGVLIYFILSDGRMPFSSGDRNFFDKLEDADMCIDASEMRNIESPVFVLRNLGVPHVWVDIVASLLQRDPSQRLTVMQVLTAFPDVAKSAVEVLKGVDDII